MNTILMISIVSGGVLIVGSLLGYLIGSSKWNRSARTKSQNLLKQAEVKAESIKNDKILQAKEKFLQLKADHDKQVNERQSGLQQAESRIKNKENELQRKSEELNRKDRELEQQKQQLAHQSDIHKHKSEELEKAHRHQVEL